MVLSGARRGFLTLFVPWLLFLPLIGVLVDERWEGEIRAPIADAQRDWLTQSQLILNRHLGFLQRDLRLLAQSPSMERALGEGRSLDLSRLFATLSEASQVYDQIRWIDEQGMERVRVDLKQGHAVRVAATDLQDKSRRGYFIESMRLQPGQVYFSRLDLNVEHGQVERPIKPTLRAAMPVADAEGRPRGIVILNYLAAPLLQQIAALPNRFGQEMNWVDVEGNWLLAPREDAAWGFMLGHPERTLAARHPEVWRQMQQTERGTWSGEEGVWSFDHFELGGDALSPVVRRWTLAMLMPGQALRQEALTAQSTVILGVLFLLALTGWFAARIAITTRDRNQALQALTERGVELDSANQALQRSLEHLSQTQDELVRAGKLSSLGLMVAGIAHELNTPIGGAIVSLSVMRQRLEQLSEQLQRGLRKSELDQFMADQQEGVELLGRNLDRSANLVRTFKQLASDRSTAERRSFDLAEVIDEALHFVRHRFSKTRQTLDVLMPEGVMLDSYPGPLGQAVENLVNNALLHAFPDDQEGRVRVEGRLEADGQKIVLVVEDNGCGIAEEHRDKIFDPFYTTRRNRGGTGLGLHIVHEMVHTRLGGTIQAVFPDKGGTRFTVTLPVHAPQPVPTSEE